MTSKVSLPIHECGKIFSGGNIRLHGASVPLTVHSWQVSSIPAPDKHFFCVTSQEGYVWKVQNELFPYIWVHSTALHIVCETMSTPVELQRNEKLRKNGKKKKKPPRVEEKVIEKVRCLGLQGCGGTWTKAKVSSTEAA